MKTITFMDKSTLEVSDASTIYSATGVFETGEAMLDAWGKFTKENMVAVWVGDEEFSNIIPVSISAEIDENGLYIATFINRATTEMEQIAQAIKDNQDAIAELGELVG